MQMLENMDVTPLLTTDALQTRIKAMGQQISRDYRGQPTVFLIVMKGAMMFAADLMRQVTDVPLEIATIGIASYKGTTQSDTLAITQPCQENLTGKHVVIIEDIVDTGHTVEFLLHHIQTQFRPLSLKLCTLLSKPEVHQHRFPLTYVGFEISREFVIGYGLDYDGRYREFDHILQVTKIHGAGPSA